MEEHVSLPGAFNLTGAIPLFYYLTTPSPRIQQYRAIMRTLLHFHREYQQYINEQEIREAVSLTLGADYPIEQCKEDLDYLRQNGNVTATYDTSRVASIAAILHRPLLYRATPEAIALEIFLEDQLHREVRVGALDKSNLSLIYEALSWLEQHLSQPSLTAQQAQDIAEQWKRVFDLWHSLSDNTALYLNTIAQAARQGGSDLEAYMAYKIAVVEYVHSFADSLLTFGPATRELLSGWITSGKKEQLIRVVAQHRYDITPATEDKEPFIAFEQAVRYEVDALLRWFARGGNTELFRRRASMEVEHVVRRAATFSFAGRSPTNFVAQLQMLARQLSKVHDIEEAQQLFAAAFASITPMHFSETLFGAADIKDRTLLVEMWDRSPSATLRLWPLGQRSRGEQTPEAPIIDRQREIRLLKAKMKRHDEEQQQRFASLFANELVDIGTLKGLDSKSRALLEEILDFCLMNQQSQYVARDGTIITLLNRDEQTRIALVGADGILRLPHYRLKSQRPNR